MTQSGTTVGVIAAMRPHMICITDKDIVSFANGNKGNVNTEVIKVIIFDTCFYNFCSSLRIQIDSFKNKAKVYLWRYWHGPGSLLFILPFIYSFRKINVKKKSSTHSVPYLYNSILSYKSRQPTYCCREVIALDN